MNSFEQLEPWSWPLARLGEAIALLARRNGLTSDTTVLTAPSAECAADDDMLNRWVDAYTAQLGVEAEAVSTSYAAADHMLQRGGPAVLRVGPASAPRFLLLLEQACHGRVLGPDGTARRIDPTLIAAALRAPLEVTRDQQVNQLLDATAVPRRRRARARARLLEEQLSTAEINAGWLLRLPPGADFLQQMRHAGLPRQFAVFLIAYVGPRCCGLAHGGCSVAPC